MSTLPPRVYLLDVEGTIAPISLVSEQLFPYARARFAAFLERNIGDAGVQADLTLLAEENQAEADPGRPTLVGAPGLDSETWESTSTHIDCHPERAKRVEGPAFRDASLAYLLWLMDRDRKSTALKSLQGKIWKAGFESGELMGTLFADVPAALARWSAQGQVAIYSSGSVEAQRLLFRHSIFGDLTALIAGYFDTRTGAKKDRASYAAIAAQMGVGPEEAVFFSDVVAELDAAREAGLETRLVVREGNAVVNDAHGHAAIETLDETF
jgi:enolase-phosphatase E1